MARSMRSNLTKKKRVLVVELARYSAALVIPLFLLGAHFHQGADIPFTNALYSFSLCVIFALTILFTGFRSLPLGVGLVASIFLIWLSLGLFGNWYQARHEVLALAAAGAVAATGYLIGTHSGGLRLAWSALIWSLILFTLMAAYLHFTGTTEGGRFSRRLSGGFGSPNTAATLFGLAVLLAASKLTMRFQDSRLSRLSRADRINYLAQKEYASLTLFILASLCLILTISRAGIAIGFMCLLGLMIFELARISRRGRLRFLRRPAFQLPVGSLVIVLMFLVVTGEINPHRSESLLENADGRTDLFSIYWTIWLEDPWFGHGLGSFNTLNDARATLDTAPAMVSIGAVHNVVLQWLVQQGLLGLIIMGLILIMILTPIIAALRAPSRKPRHFLRLAIAATLLVFGHGMVDYALEIPSVMWTYAFILGLAAGYSTLTRSTQQAGEE